MPEVKVTCPTCKLPVRKSQLVYHQDTRPCLEMVVYQQKVSADPNYRYCGYQARKDKTSQ